MVNKEIGWFNIEMIVFENNLNKLSFLVIINFKPTRHCKLCFQTNIIIELKLDNTLNFSVFVIEIFIGFSHKYCDTMRQSINLLSVKKMGSIARLLKKMKKRKIC